MVAISSGIDLGGARVGIGGEHAIAFGEGGVFDEDDRRGPSGDQGGAAGVEVGTGGRRTDGFADVDPVECELEPLGVVQKLTDGALVGGVRDRPVGGELGVCFIYI